MSTGTTIDWDKLKQLLVDSINPFSYTILRNPFQKIPFIDVPSINESVTKKFLSLLARVQQTGETSSMLILGQTGVGKTHVLRRIKQLCQGKALYIYVEPYGDPHRVYLHILRRVIGCLQEKIEGERYTQLEEFGATILTKLLLPRLERLKGLGQNDYILKKVLQDKHIIHSFKKEKNIQAIVAAAKKDILELMPDIYLQFFSVLIKSLFEPYRISAYQWLQGTELEDKVLASLGVPYSISTEENARFALFTLGKLSRLYLPLVICFDQLENLPGNKQKSGISLFASVYTYLHDNVENLLLISTCLLEKWQEEFTEQINLSERKRFDNHQINLNATLSYNQAYQVVERRLSLVYQEQPLPYPTYPFPPGYIRELADERLLTIRDIMENCCDHISRIKDEGIVREPRSFIKTEASSQEIVYFIQDNWYKRKAEWAGEIFTKGIDGDTLKGCFYEVFRRLATADKPVIDNTKVKKVEYDDSLKGHQLLLYLSQERHEWQVRLIFCNTQNGRDFANLMKRLLEKMRLEGSKEKYIVFRDERLFPIEKNWKKGLKYLSDFQAKGGILYKIRPETQLRFLALRDLLYDANSKDLVIKGKFITTQEIINFALENQLVQDLPELKLLLVENK
jgi:Cdc6-like AAA superfamily ATPase